MSDSVEQARIEARRLSALRECDLLDTPPEPAFDRLAALAAELFRTPIGLVSLVDEDRQWFKARIGITETETPRAWSFCAHAVEGGAWETLVVEDATADPRFSDNPLVLGEPHIRFYAGVALTTQDGDNLGTLCVIDRKARKPPPAAALDRLRRLASIAIDEIELRNASRALAIAKVEAEAAAEAKAQFLANMSHELRTPLTAVVGFARLAAEQDDLGDVARGYVDRLTIGARALMATVNDILDFSKLESGQVEIRPRPVAPGQVIAEAASMFEGLAGERGLRLSILGADDLPPAVSLDDDRLRQVLLNLIGNAVKFTETGGVTITADWRAGEGRLLCRISDTGRGIEPDQMERLFQRFSQIDGSGSRGQGGTGLGLAICKGLVEAMGGSIGASSRPGEGSTFHFSIPAPTAAGADDEAAVSPDLAAGGVRILVADDHSTNRELVRLMLAPFAMEIIEAGDGQEAVDAALARPFDVILMDVRMPVMSGAEAAVEIRRLDGPNQQTPILAFSADVLTDHRLFDGVVAKPLEAAVLLQSLSRALDPAPMQG